MLFYLLVKEETTNSEFHKSSRFALGQFLLLIAIMILYAAYGQAIPAGAQLAGQRVIRRENVPQMEYIQVQRQHEIELIEREYIVPVERVVQRAVPVPVERIVQRRVPVPRQVPVPQRVEIPTQRFPFHDLHIVMDIHICPHMCDPNVDHV